MSSPLAGALMITFFAPAVMWAAALSAFVKRPVDSRTMSTPRSPQGRAAGSFSLRTLISWPSMISASSVWSTVPGYAPYVESCLNSSAFSDVSTRSLTATTSTSGVRSMSALSDWRPIRPKPLMPTRTAMRGSFATRSPTDGRATMLLFEVGRRVGAGQATRATAERMVASYAVGRREPLSQPVRARLQRGIGHTKGARRRRRAPFGRFGMSGDQPPILKTLPLQIGQVPDSAGLPFFMVIFWGF